MSLLSQASTSLLWQHFPLSSLSSLINLAGSKLPLRLVSSQLLWRTVSGFHHNCMFSKTEAPCPSAMLHWALLIGVWKNDCVRWVPDFSTLSFWVCMQWKRLTSTSLCISPSLWGSNHFLSRLKTDHVSPVCNKEKQNVFKILFLFLKM